LLYVKPLVLCAVYLVVSLYWGKIIMIEQTIQGETRDKQTTSGKYKIIEIYDPEYQKQITQHETDKGLSYF